jgi:DNA polymerase III epsilon subunit-like protein
MTFTAFHFSNFNHAHKENMFALCGVRFSGTEIQSRLAIESKDFPIVWEAFVKWYDGSVLVGRNLHRTCNRLGELFQEHKIEPPVGFKGISYLDILRVE